MNFLQLFGNKQLFCSENYQWLTVIFDSVQWYTYLSTDSGTVS